jgi:hypothetical protein
MPTGDGRPPARRLALAVLAAAGLLVAAGCEEIEEPVVSVSLRASAETVATDQNVTITATVTEGDEPVEGVAIQFSASPVGSFPDGQSVTTGAGGEAETTFVVASTEIDSDTLVDVTATEAASEAIDTVTILVEADDRGPR